MRETFEIFVLRNDHSPNYLLMISSTAMIGGYKRGIAGVCTEKIFNVHRNDRDRGSLSPMAGILSMMKKSLDF